MTADDRATCVTCARRVKVPRRGLCRSCHVADLTARRNLGPIAGRIGSDPVLRMAEHIEITDECWLWQGQLNNGGYGLFCIHGRKRAALEPVTASENLLRGYASRRLERSA